MTTNSPRRVMWRGGFRPPSGQTHGVLPGAANLAGGRKISSPWGMSVLFLLDEDVEVAVAGGCFVAGQLGGVLFHFLFGAGHDGLALVDEFAFAFAAGGHHGGAVLGVGQEGSQVGLARRAAHHYIVPGLGDAGDLAYGTKE